MAIRFTPEYNKEIRRVVRNFNRRRNAAMKAGVFKNRIPNAIKVNELKASYKSRNELNKALEQLSRFSTKSTANLTRIDDNFKSTVWFKDYIKNNQNLAKQYFEEEFKRVEKRTLKYPGERDYLDTISAKIDLLNKDVSNLDEREYKASLSAINEFVSSSSVRRSNYRGFLSEVELVMDKLNIDEAKKDSFFKKFEQLTPSQFLYAYDNNDIIARVYALYFKRNAEGEVVLNTTSGSAKQIIQALFDQVDFIIEDAKKNAD